MNTTTYTPTPEMAPYRVEKFCGAWVIKDNADQIIGQPIARLNGAKRVAAEMNATARAALGAK